MGQRSGPSLHTLRGETVAGLCPLPCPKGWSQTGLSPRDLEPADEGLERSCSVLSTPQCLCSTLGKCEIKSCWWVSLHFLTPLKALGSDPLSLIPSSSLIGLNKSEEQECSFFWKMPSLVVELRTSLGTGVTGKLKFKPAAF